MKVVIVSHGVTDQSLLGGPGRVAAEHAAELGRRGHDVEVVTTDLVWKGRRASQPTFALVGNHGVSVLYAPAYSIGRWPGSIGPVLSPRSRQLISDAVRSADVVHAHEWAHGLTQMARRASHRLQKAFLVQPHGSIQVRHGAHSVLHACYNSLHRLRSKDGVIAGTQREADEIRAVLRPVGPIHQLLNAMRLPETREDDARVEARRASWGWPPEARVLLYAHRITPNKGLDLAIEALADLPDNNYLAVVGEDGGGATFSEHCRALVTRLGLDARVRFVGAVTRDEVDEVILAADVFLLPARRDTFPLMVLHAMACGRPVVVTNTCQSVDAIGGGISLCEPTSVGVRDAIASLRPGAARALGEAGRQIIRERFSPQAIGEQLETIYAASLDLMAAGA